MMYSDVEQSTKSDENYEIHISLSRDSLLQWVFKEHILLISVFVILSEIQNTYEIPETLVVC